MLTLSNISYTYPTSLRPAVDDVSCVLQPGKLAALIGNNGCGKSTLAKIAAGLIKPQSGEVEIDNDRSPHNPPLLRGEEKGGSEPQGGSNFPIGIVFQNPEEQFITHSVETEIAWGLENLNTPRDEMIRCVAATLQQFNLTNIAHHAPESLSDGQKQLVAIASVASMNPMYYILDEVSSFLDPHWNIEIRHIARELAKTAGVLWISTRTSDALFADEVWVMDDGKLVVQGMPDDVLTPELIAGLDLEPVR